MDEKNGHSSLEDILTAVEQDPTLSAAESESGMSQAEQHTTDFSATFADGGASQKQEASAASGLGALFSQPDLLVKLPGLLRVVQSLTEPTSKGQTSKPGSPVTLLTALRPYLNDHRRQALDTMIRVSRLSESLKSLK